MAKQLQDSHGRLSFAIPTYSQSSQETDDSRASSGVGCKTPRPQTPLYASTICENLFKLKAESKSCLTTEEASEKSDKMEYGEYAAVPKMQLLEFASLVVSAEGRSQIDLKNVDFGPLLTASIDPPVTKASLSELDITRILNDSRLRHDLNFERDVAFRPNYDGERGKRKKALAKDYWTALTVEFAFYIERARSSGSSCLLDNLATLKLHWRLPQMFRTIKAILITLLRIEDRPAVEEVFDIELIVQQLEKGVCDLLGIANWLGDVLKGSCSPVRDTLVVSVIDQIRQAIHAVDPIGLARGIEQVFGVLETMKLDVANHQIRFLRLIMINDSTQYEQRHFLSRIASGMDVVEARGWYETVMSSDPSDHTPESEDSTELDSYIQDDDQILFARTVVDLVCDPASLIPNTFMYDKERIQSLRVDFQKCLLQTVVAESYCRLLRKLQCPKATSSLCDIYKFLFRIWQIDQNCLADISKGLVLDEIVLEITRLAYEDCSVEALPKDNDMATVRSYIQSAIVRDSDLYHDILASTWDELDILIEQEVEAIYDLEPLQILNYYHPNTTSQVKFEISSLHDVAQRVAHIAVLHWRVWGPILYLQPKELVQGSVPNPCSARYCCENMSTCSFRSSGESELRACSCTGSNTSKKDVECDDSPATNMEM